MRSASSLMRGSATTPRTPDASTWPSIELAASLFTTSGPGRLARVMDNTSSSRRGGATRTTRRLESRSMIRASATMEQAISGQIGQPAACMIESNVFLLR
jgi:hypothetical protein